MASFSLQLSARRSQCKIILPMKHIKQVGGQIYYFLVTFGKFEEEKLCLSHSRFFFLPQINVRHTKSCKEREECFHHLLGIARKMPAINHTLWNIVVYGRHFSEGKNCVYNFLGMWLVGQRVGEGIEVVGGSIWSSVLLLVGNL